MVENNQVGVSGEFTHREPGREKCDVHPLCFKGSCGFYLDRPHGWQPEPLSTPNIRLKQQDFDDIVNWTISHQVTHHHVVALNEQQYRVFKRYDKVGIVELPSFIKEVTPIQHELKSHEVKNG